nr:dienelactone hydrolase family protein [Propionibacterium sp.]
METRFDRLDVPAAEGSAVAYLARPVTGAHPAVLLIPDVLGLRPQIRAMAERVASWGYVVLAPNLVYREHPGVPLSDADLTDPDAFADAVTALLEWTLAVSREDTAADAAVWLDWLAAQEFVTGDRVGLTGYCRGGFLALWLAEALGERVAAVGVFHAGGLVSDDPHSLHRGVGAIRGEVLLRHADHDPGMPPAAMAALATALEGAGVRFDQAVYLDAPHGYTMADTFRYDEDAAELHFEELRELLDRAL